MRLRDEHYTATPLYGIRRMTAWVRQQGYAVTRKRVGRLLRQMGLDAIYPTPRLSRPAADHVSYPYLLRGVTVDRGNQVWSADIPSVRLAPGCVYLVAVIDWYSRYVLAWVVSSTMDVRCCLEALEQAFRWGRPEVFNTDPGAQFTSQEFPAQLRKEGVRISMDGRGRALDNVCVERLWRSVTWAEVSLRDDQSAGDARQHLARYFGFYNRERLHQALGYRTPAAVYHDADSGLELARAHVFNRGP